MSDVVYIDTSKFSLGFKVETPTCDKCGKESGLLLFGVCADCISMLIQADKAKKPYSKGVESG